VANQRLFYRDGTVVRVESDADGDGVFTLSSAAGKGGE
jgi:hypothetical protein